MSEIKREIRRKFKAGVLARDNMTCQVCGAKHTDPEKFDAHHIVDRHHFKNGGYVLENGITVCDGDCHEWVETYHNTKGAGWVEGLHPDQLFEKIGSPFRLLLFIREQIEI